ncbi:DJ-1/PfpI family protein [Methanobacterium formicicum]|uniref:DJ-1/PfpI family protein n=2 Tax=Methanobacterium TaxID=2160 RepID=A0A843ARS0_METFO|nr:DJ-1/PfpI family protein [Methanobacterium formicicum]MBF4474253.1 DJ-1/PfpI family protein [Methanobacterium formicicum]
MHEVITVLFDGFETLDVFGPVEILGRLENEFKLHFHSIDGGIVKSSQRVPVLTESLSSLDFTDYILMIPGGMGTRKLVKDEVFLDHLKPLALNAEYILTICTGSILLARTGLLNDRNATTNKRVFVWTNNFPEVNWVREARWVQDGNIYTSSGVSAGMDMALGFVADQLGYNVAKKQSIEIEYEWKEDSTWDPFSKIYSSVK